MCFFGVGEAVSQIVGFCLIGGEKARREIHDDPLVGYGLVNRRPVDVVVVDQDNVVGQQWISSAFNQVVHLAFQEDDDFIKVVVVEFKFILRNV